MRYWRGLVRAVVLAGALGAASPAVACPMCRAALKDATDPATSARPRAYMYSILFMLSMPATLFTGFSVAFYRLSRQQQQLFEAQEFGEFTDDDPS